MIIEVPTKIYNELRRHPYNSKIEETPGIIVVRKPGTVYIASFERIEFIVGGVEEARKVRDSLKVIDGLAYIDKRRRKLVVIKPKTRLVSIRIPVKLYEAVKEYARLVKLPSATYFITSSLTIGLIRDEFDRSFLKKYLEDTVGIKVDEDRMYM